MQVFLTFVLIIFMTKLAGHICVRLGQPSVLGKLLAGIILGPALLNWVQPSEFIDTIAQIGVILLMFIAGVETDLQQMKQNWKAAFAVAIGGVILPLFGGYGLGVLFNFTQGQAIFLGLLFCATSVSISVQTLKELNKLNSNEGTTILGAAVVDDVVVVILLAFVMSFLGAGSDVSLPLIVGKKVIFFVVIIAACIWLVPLLMKWFAKFKVTEVVLSMALIITFGFSYFAEWLGVAGIIGAFAAGLAIGQTPYKTEVEHKVEPLAYSIFVPVFFVSIGLNISFEGLGNHIWFIVLLTVMAIFSKLIGGGLGAKMTGFNFNSSLIIGSGMISRGEVALIIAATGLSSGLLLQEYFTPVILVVILTTLVTPPLLKLTIKREQAKDVKPSEQLQAHL